MQRFLLSAALALLWINSASAQDGEWWGGIRVPVWSIDRDGEFVTIVYGLSDSLSTSFDVSLKLANTEQRVLVEPDAVTGHIGNVPAGALRKIIWHYRHDYPSGLRGSGWKFILNIEWGRQKIAVATREGSFTPPRLRIGSTSLSEPNGNGILDAGEKGELSFAVHNEGLGAALGMSAKVQLVSAPPGVHCDTVLACGDLLVGGAMTLRVPVTGDKDLQTGTARIALRVQDALQGSVATDTVRISAQAFLPPLLEITEIWLQSALSPTPRPLSDAPLLVRGDTTALIFCVKNSGRGKAEGVSGTLALEGDGWNAHLLGPSHSVPAGNLLPDSAVMISFTILGDERAEADSIGLSISIAERHPEFGIAKSIRLPARKRFLTFDAQFADLIRRGLIDSAGVLCKRQMVIEPHRAALYADLGDVYERLHDRTRAVEMYVAASERGDRRAMLWLEANATYREVTSVRYEAMPLPFLDAGGSVTIGVFPLSSEGEASSDGELYNTLRSSTDRNRITLVPYRAMVSQLGMKALKVSDAAALGRAAKDLGITYVVDARGSSAEEFTLSITRTIDSQSIFTRHFQASATSTAMGDVGRLFKDSMVPLYNTKRLYKPKTARGG